MTEVAGFIAADDKGTIHGMALTGAGALLDATSNLGMRLFLWPATHDLMTNLGPWKVVDGIAIRDTSDGP